MEKVSVPSEPRQCQHGNWNAADCKDCKIKSLQAEVERLREREKELSDELFKVVRPAMEHQTKRADQSKRKLAEAQAECERQKKISLQIMEAADGKVEQAERKLAEAVAECERLRSDPMAEGWRQAEYARKDRQAALNNWKAERQRAESAERKLAEAEAALRKYGEHKQHCALYIGLPKMKCSCGFDEATK